MCSDPRAKAGTAPLELIKARGYCVLSERADRLHDIVSVVVYYHPIPNMEQNFLFKPIRNYQDFGIQF